MPGLPTSHFAAGMLPGARTEVAKAVTIIDASWSQLSNDQSKLTFPSRVMRFYGQYVDFLVSENRGEEALAFAESRRAACWPRRWVSSPRSTAAQDFRRLAQAGARRPALVLARPGALLPVGGRAERLPHRHAAWRAENPRAGR